MKKLIQRVQLKMKNKQAFTLIELIVVIAIIAILVAILVPNVTKFINTAKNTTTDANAKTIYVAAQTYITDKYTAGTAVAANSVTDTMLGEYVSSTLLAKYTITITNSSTAVTLVTITDKKDTTITSTYPK